MEVKNLCGGFEVGRSAIYLKEKNTGIILNYGVNFNEKDIPQLPLHVKPAEISAIIVSHGHLDHIGAAPYLYISSTPIAISTKPTMDIARYLTIDFLKLSSYYIEYEIREFDRMYSKTMFLNYGEDIDVGGFNIRLYNAGHILGSSLAYIEVGDEKILYTGDFNTIQTWTLNPADTPPHKPTTLIIESTYGSRNHPPRHIVEKHLLEVVEETIDNNGVVLIPAFSVGRTQEILTLLYSQAPYLDIYIDGMSREITELYVKHRKFLRDPDLFAKIVENIEFVVDSSMRKKIIRKPCVIIASAGMLKGGPSLYYLKQLYSSQRNTVILVSYQTINSSGHKILEQGQLEEQGIGPIKTRLEWLDFSSHAGRDDIVRYVEKYKNTLKNIIIIHGSPEDAHQLQQKLEETIDQDVKIHTPINGDTINL